MAIQTDSVASWVFAKRLLAVGTLGECEGPEGECATRPFVGAGIAGSGGAALESVRPVRSKIRVVGGLGEVERGRERSREETMEGREQGTAEAGVEEWAEEGQLSWSR